MIFTNRIEENNDYARLLLDLLENKNNEFYPYQMSLGVTPKCNSRCNYCTNWQDTESSINTFETLADIITNAKEIGVKQILFSGGEPLLYNRLFDLIKHTKSLDLDFLIISNFLACDEKMLDRLIVAGCKKIGVSLDTIRQDNYKKIRGVPLNNLLELLKVAKKKMGDNEQNISLCCTVHKMNCDELDEVLDYGLNNGFAVQFQPIQLDMEKSNEITDKFWPSDEQIERLKVFFDKVIDLKLKGYKITNSLEYLENIYSYFNKGIFKPEKCFAPYAQITIDQALRLRGCWAMEPIGKISKGSDLKLLWNSDKMNSIRSMVSEGKCQGCFYSCHLSKKYTKF